MDNKPLPKDSSKKVVENNPDKYEGYMQVGPQKWFLPDIYQNYAESLRNFSVNSSDVFVCGIPRSGTTMTQEIVWLLTHNLDYEKAKSFNSYKRILMFEAQVLAGLKRTDMEKTSINNYESFEEAGNHRVVKSHLPFCLGPASLLTCGAKIIYVLRYVKDVVKSMYIISESKGSFEEYWDLYENGLRLFTPYWEHVKQGLEQITNENVLIVCYEDLIENPHEEITRISEFLGKNYTEEEINSLAKFMNYDSFKTTFRNTFSAGGKIIGEREPWKKYFSDDLNRRANGWIEKNGKKLEYWTSKYGHYQ